MKTRRITLFISLTLASISHSCKSQVPVSEVRISQDSLFFRNEFVGLGSQRYGSTTPVTEFFTDLTIDKGTIKEIEAATTKILGHTAFIYTGQNPHSNATPLTSFVNKELTSGDYLMDAATHVQNIGATLILQATAVPILIVLNPYIGIPVSIGSFVYEVVEIYSVSKSLKAAGAAMNSGESN